MTEDDWGAAAGSRLQDEYWKWIERSEREDVLFTRQAFVAGWMAYARIAAKEWPDCKVRV